MRIGITGAAGFLGAALLRRLAAAAPGDTFVPFCARRTANPLTDHLGIRHVALDVTDRAGVLAATRGLDALYHVAGMVSYDRRSRRRAWDVNVHGTRNVIDAAAANGIGKVIYVSSISVLGAPSPEAPWADEGNDRYVPGRNPISFPDAEAALAAVEDSLRGDYRFLSAVRVPYFDSKLAAFEDARRTAAARGVSLVTVMPGTAVGAGDTGMAIGGLVQRVWDGALRLTLPGGTSFVASEDVAAGIAAAAARGRPGEAYIITGREQDNLGYAAFMRMVARVAAERFHHRCFDRFRSVPAPAAVAVASVVEGLFPGTALPRGLVLSGCVTHRFGSRKAGEELGYVPRVPLEDAIASCIEFNLHVLQLKEKAA